MFIFAVKLQLEREGQWKIYRTCKCINSGALVSSILAAKDKQATANNRTIQAFPLYRRIINLSIDSQKGLNLRPRASLSDLQANHE